MECTIRNFIEGCILDAHPMSVVFGGLILLGCLGILSLCLGAILAPPLGYYEETRKKKEQTEHKEQKNAAV